MKRMERWNGTEDEKEIHEERREGWSRRNKGGNRMKELCFKESKSYIKLEEVLCFFLACVIKRNTQNFCLDCDSCNRKH